MADAPTAAPTANPPAQPPPVPVVLTEAEMAQLEEMYVVLKKEALQEARNHVLARTPVRLQEAMTAKVDGDFPLPPEPAPADPAYTPPAA